jgi:hypothetical protein
MHSWPLVLLLLSAGRVHAALQGLYTHVAWRRAAPARRLAERQRRGRGAAAVSSGWPPRGRLRGLDRPANQQSGSSFTPASNASSSAATDAATPPPLPHHSRPVLHECTGRQNEQQQRPQPQQPSQRGCSWWASAWPTRRWSMPPPFFRRPGSPPRPRPSWARAAFTLSVERGRRARERVVGELVPRVASREPARTAKCNTVPHSSEKMQNTFSWCTVAYEELSPPADNAPGIEF